MGRGAAKKKAGGAKSEAQGADASGMSAVQKFLSIDAGWSKKDFPEVFDVLFWLRVPLSVIAGVVFGFNPFPAPASFFMYGGAVFVLPYVYVVRVLGMDEEELGQLSLLTEGGGACFGLFVLVWITTYTLAQEHS